MSRGRQRRGTALVATVVLLVIAQLVVVTTIVNGGRDHDVTARQIEGLRAMYAAESAMHMALREIQVSADEDGDGQMGSISDDGDPANDPTLGNAALHVRRDDVGSQVHLTSDARDGLARRSLRAEFDVVGGIGLPLAAGRARADATPRTVGLLHRFTSPVVVCTVNYENNTAPVVVRVANVTATSFDVWLQNPGDLTTPLSEEVHFLVVEAGVHLIDGVRFEAQRTLITVTDDRKNWDAEDRTYLQAYAQPVVVGQVMTANDPDWSVFWARGKKDDDPPEISDLGVGKHVAEDADTTRNPELVGFVVFEAGSGTLAGIAMDAQLSCKCVRGIDNAPPYAVPFNSPFLDPPQILLASSAGMDDGNGAWPVLYRSPIASSLEAYVAVDEDQIRDTERKHKNERVAVVTFATPTGEVELAAWVELPGVP